MAVYINTNVSSLGAQRSLMINGSSLSNHYERLGSGYRINAADDDAANLHISNRLSSQVNGYNQGNRNANDGIALAQTIEGALNESTQLLQKIRTLAVQAANGTNTDEDRIAIQDEVNSYAAEISRIAQKTTFGGAQMLDGMGPGQNGTNLINADGSIQFQVGANAHTTISVDLSTSYKLSAVYAACDLQVTTINQDGDNWADATGANGSGLVATTDEDGNVGPVRFAFSTADLAQKSLEHIDKAIKFIDSKRSELGSVANRMESTIRNSSNISENTSDTRSRIRDTDFAAETASLTSTNIVQQASQSVLAQANQRPQWVVQLLQ